MPFRVSSFSRWTGSVWASSPYGHSSPYGGYISKQYSAYGTTYNALAPDPLLIRLVVQACDERERKRSDGGGDADHDESKKPESKLRRAL